MKALTLTQPWATLVAIGAKSIETRDWNTRYRGELLITAAKKFPSDCRCLCPLPPFGEVLGVETLHTGCALALVSLVECFPFDNTTLSKIRGRAAKGWLPRFEDAFGDYGAGRCGFVFRGLRRLHTPIPCKGMLGLWDVPTDLEAAVREQLPTEAVAS